MKLLTTYGAWVFLIFCLIVSLQNPIGAEASEDDRDCQLPGGERGECIALPACTQYLTLLQESTTTELGLKLTQERRCGLEGNNPKVCCPTTTEDLDPVVRTNLDEDFEELPAPEHCGRRKIESAPYVWNGKPVKSRLAYEGVFSSLYPQDSATPAGHYGYVDLTSSSPGDVAPPISGGMPVRKTGENMSLPSRGTPEYPVFAIAGGRPLRNMEMAMWMALLAYRRSPSMWECGGSIITRRHVLTAAHCIRESLYVVRVGELDLAATDKKFSPIDLYVKKKIRHEHYTKYHNDIAIVVVEGTIPIDDPKSFQYIAPICLPEPGFPYERRDDHSTFITGWGETQNVGERPSFLLYAYLNILDQESCKKAYSNEALTIDERVFCAGDKDNGRDACNGDSGGPLIGKYYLPAYYGLYYYQVGLISYGYRCSAQRFTGVYTNVTHFMPWIVEKVTGRREPRQWTITTKTPLFLQYNKPLAPKV